MTLGPDDIVKMTGEELETKPIARRRCAIATYYGIYLCPMVDTEDEEQDASEIKPMIVATHHFEEEPETYNVLSADEAVAQASELLKGAGMLYAGQYGPHQGQARMMSKVMEIFTP